MISNTQSPGFCNKLSYCVALFICGMIFFSCTVTVPSPQDSTASFEVRQKNEKHLAGKKKWKLLFHEKFNGQAVDTSVWSMYNGPGHARNGLRSPAAFSQKDGLLIVTAETINGNIVSGGMAHRKNYKYGKFEFRVRTEADSSMAMSGVVLTWPQSGKWPVDGENDMYETLTDADRKPFHTFIHYGKDNKQHHFRHEGDGTQWHVMAMEWDENNLSMFRDNKLVWTLSDTLAIPDVPHHICIQLDAFKKHMTGKVKMYVDWVKIYQRK